MIRPYYLLDTNIISELMNQQPDKHVITKIKEYERFCALSSTSWNELLYGINIMPAGKKRDFYFDTLVDKIQAEFEII